MHAIDQSQYGAWLRALISKLSGKSSSQNSGKKHHYDTSSFGKQQEEDGVDRLQELRLHCPTKLVKNIHSQSLGTK